MGEETRPKCASDTVEILGSRWNRMIIWNLRDGPRRFSELKRQMDDVSSKTLTYHLKMLEQRRIISRTVFPETPPRVEYALAERGRALIPAFAAMIEWNEAYANAEKDQR
jgi:DNA-binding HxlR family transcriptional regulator